MKFEEPCNAAALYARLRARQPVDYGAFLHSEPGRRILSFSPELFFRIDDEVATRRIVTRPMKGTARRGRTTREDREIAEWLANDPKNRSENVMIVDLVRNDLGRVAQTGSVKVEQLFAVERYPTLWQMTSTVSAELRPEVGFHDVFRALFPCGSVTGAPKVRATQLISQLEDAPRGVYTGAIGFFSSRQTVFNVAIRTLELDGARGTIGVGSGVVIDSDPAAEYRECLLKAEFLTGPAHRTTNPISENAPIASQPDSFFLIETLLWDGCYQLLEFHLDRLEDSAAYFDFSCDRAAVRAALEDHARPFAEAATSSPRSPRRVRLLVDADGGAQIGSEELVPPGNPNRVVRVTISSVRTDSADATLYHKTTHRQLYNHAFEQAVRDGFDDVLFLNLKDEVTEGAISNIFVVKDGRWFTPPIECGLLAGVYRRHLLETRPEIEQRVLSLGDLRTADAIYLCNAVRGLRRVIIAG
jgi:para-aminobenzoate synthetase/4-amino-4-deoxychorismate lyase